MLIRKSYLTWPGAVLSFLLLSGCSLEKSGYNLHATLALLIILAIIILFVCLALYSNMLRDEVNDCETFNQKAAAINHKRGRRLVKPENPYSLSRVQLGVWTVIISCSFIYLALCKGDCTDAPISQTALILMGIGVGVTTASTLIDKREIQDNRPRHQNEPSEGFLIDILSDDNGISLHRFQNVVWTVIAMVVYLAKVYSIKAGCSLPELSQTLLILTGISSTTYLVLKANENNPSIDAAVNYNTGNNTVTVPSPALNATVVTPPDTATFTAPTANPTTTTPDNDMPAPTV